MGAGCHSESFMVSSVGLSVLGFLEERRNMFHSLEFNHSSLKHSQQHHSVCLDHWLLMTSAGRDMSPITL